MCCNPAWQNYQPAGTIPMAKLAPSGHLMIYLPRALRAGLVEQSSSVFAFRGGVAHDESNCLAGVPAESPEYS